MVESNFLQKPFDLALSSQRLIERLLENGQGVEKVPAVITIVFSYLDTVYRVITYEADVCRAIQGFTITHFEHLFPNYFGLEATNEHEEESAVRATGMSPISFLFNISMLQTDNPQAEKGLRTQETRVLPKSKGRKELADTSRRIDWPPQPESIFKYVINLQKELATTLSLKVQKASDAFLESQNQAMYLASVATKPKAAILSETIARPAIVPKTSAAKAPKEIKPEKTKEPQFPLITREKQKTVRKIVTEELEETELAPLQWIIELQKRIATRTLPPIEKAQLLPPAKVVSEPFISVKNQTTFPLGIATEEVMPAEPKISSDVNKTPLSRLEESSAEKEKMGSPPPAVHILAETVVLRKLPSLIEYVQMVPALILAKSIEEAQVPRLPPIQVADETDQSQNPLTTDLESAENKLVISHLIAYLNSLPALTLGGRKTFITTEKADIPFVTPASGFVPSLDQNTEATKIRLNAPQMPLETLPTSYFSRILKPLLANLHTVQTILASYSRSKVTLTSSLAERIQNFRETEVNLVKKAREPFSHTPELDAESSETEISQLPSKFTKTTRRSLRKNQQTIEEHPALKGREKLKRVPQRRKGEKRFYREENTKVFQRGAIEKAEVLSYTPIQASLSIEEQISQKPKRREPATLIEDIQHVWAIYAKNLPDLAVSGPIRTTMLDELSAGMKVSEALKPNAMEEPAFQKTSEPVNFDQQFDSSKNSFQTFREFESKSIDVSLSANTANEDLRVLERKIGKILSEQLSDTGLAPPVTSAIPSQARSGLLSSGLPDLYASHTASTRLVRQGSIHGGINLNIVTDAEDLRELEKKIRQILAKQICGYYGTSRL